MLCWLGLSINGYRFALWQRAAGDAIDFERVTDERIAHWIVFSPGQVTAESLRRMAALSRRWGHGWMTVGHLWPRGVGDVDDLGAWIARAGELAGRAVAQSDGWVSRMARRAHLVIAAWGADGSAHHRGAHMLELLAAHGIRPHALGLTESGEPVGPLDGRDAGDAYVLDVLRGRVAREHGEAA